MKRFKIAVLKLYSLQSASLQYTFPLYSLQSGELVTSQGMQSWIMAHNFVPNFTREVSNKYKMTFRNAKLQRI